MDFYVYYPNTHKRLEIHFPCHLKSYALLPQAVLNICFVFQYSKAENLSHVLLIYCIWTFFCMQGIAQLLIEIEYHVKNS